MNVTILRRKFARHLLIGLTQCTKVEFVNFPSVSFTIAIAVNQQHVKMVNSTSVQRNVQTGYDVTKERQSAIEIACHKKLCHLLHKTNLFDAKATSEYQRVKKLSF